MFVADVWVCLSTNGMKVCAHVHFHLSICKFHPKTYFDTSISIFQPALLRIIHCLVFISCDLFSLGGPHHRNDFCLSSWAWHIILAIAPVAPSLRTTYVTLSVKSRLKSQHLIMKITSIKVGFQSFISN